ncbi:hypothetical protein D5086_013590 [Populus alba]|uniref:Uncharacterized protein n=2 Tax=Populus TaxID=3689 RepID=A0ACC4C620_POPAL|nr:hypothetical protein NC653_017367 [Populus alba x Populus x berolinensis]
MGILIEGWQAFFGGGQEQVLPPYCPYPRFPRGRLILIGALKVCPRGNYCQQTAPSSSGNEPFDYDPSHHVRLLLCRRSHPPLQTLVKRLGEEMTHPF